MKLDQYLGNPNLKKAHTKSRFTPKQVDEVVKCLEDPKYFIEKYLKILSTIIVLQFASCQDKVESQLSLYPTSYIMFYLMIM